MAVLPSVKLKQTSPDLAPEQLFASITVTW